MVAEMFSETLFYAWCGVSFLWGLSIGLWCAVVAVERICKQHKRD